MEYRIILGFIETNVRSNRKNVCKQVFMFAVFFQNLPDRHAFALLQTPNLQRFTSSAKILRIILRILQVSLKFYWNIVPVVLVLQYVFSPTFSQQGTLAELRETIPEIPDNCWESAFFSRDVIEVRSGKENLENNEHLVPRPFTSKSNNQINKPPNHVVAMRNPDTQGDKLAGQYFSAVLRARIVSVLSNQFCGGRARGAVQMLESQVGAWKTTRAEVCKSCRSRTNVAKWCKMNIWFLRSSMYT